jgi:hypothetical protein
LPWPETASPQEGRTAARLRPLHDDDRAAHLPRTTRPPRLWPWIFGAALFALAAVAALLLEHFSHVTASLAAGGAPVPPPLPARPLDLNRLVLPGAAIVVLLVLFFAARWATSSSADKANWRNRSS